MFILKLRFTHILFLWTGFWRCLWNLSEYFGINLKVFAPWIFGQAIFCASKKQKKTMR